MPDSVKHPSIETLRRLNGLRDLDYRQLRELSERLEVLSARKGARLIQQDSADPTVFYLLEGKLKLDAVDGGTRYLSHTDPSASNPVARLRPSRYTVTAATPVAFLKIESDVLEEFTGRPQLNSSLLDSFSISEDTLDTEEGLENQLAYRLYDDLNHDRLVLPSLPAPALAICQAAEKDRDSESALADIVLTDPAMTAKLMRLANADISSSNPPVDSCLAAIERLGSERVVKLVTNFSMRELFRSGSSSLKRYMATAVQNSRRVASIARALAIRTGMFDPARAYLAGLMHEIGVLAILHYAQELPSISIDAKALDQCISNQRGNFGSAILARWNFPDDLAAIPRDTESWDRDESSHADLTDLILIARLHAYIGSKRMASLPKLDEVPAFAKLPLGKPGPNLSIELLEAAQTEQVRLERLINDNRI